MAKKKAAPAKKKPAPKTAPKPAAKAPAKPAVTANRASWLDEKTEMPLIDKYARQLDSYIETMADGVVEAKELKAQEGRLVKLMKEIEPKLPDPVHEKVTQLLCELTAYDIMQMIHAWQLARPKTAFRG